MLTLKSEPLVGEEALLASFDPANVQAELDFWEHLDFSFDMDQDQRSSRSGASSSGRGASSSRARSVSTSSAGPSRAGAQGHAGGQPPIMPTHPGQAGLPTVNPAESYEALTRALRALQEAYPYLPPHPGFPPLNQQEQIQYPPQIPHQQQQQLYNQFPWPPQSTPTSMQPPHPVQHQHFSSSLPPFPFAMGNQFSPPPPPPQINTQVPHAQSSFSAGPSTVEAPASGEGSAGGSTAGGAESEQGLTEEKRRRNTAASARFRVKKKQKSLNLERTVSDLTGRVDELEQEAADLRRENGWLKEIVMLKSRKNTGELFQDQVPSTDDGGEDEDGDTDKPEDKGEGSSKATQ
ncbi:hypothetical protein EVG20_g3326 [Dentipellis fragilis]|uniref:BZIP domain-containing protein n=1 Tax=Dentipellis fragilis TaxID=205917 RepID=A0A4Y9Z335_9AGAM|nr:hypothetical protein EVG20_g3326 [Dentipellis fragilis]